MDIYQRDKSSLTRVFRAAVLMGAGLLSGISVAQVEEAAPRTRYSQLLDEIEAEGNTASPKREIIILDTDEALLSLKPYHPAPDVTAFFVPREVISQLKERNAVPDDKTKSNISWSLNPQREVHPLHQAPQVFPYTTKEGRDVCAVVPGSLDAASATMAGNFLGSDIPSKIKADFSPESFFRHETYHELWHCLDKTFLQERFSTHAKITPVEQAVLRHRSELFAEVAASLTLAVKGETDISQQRADLRAWRSYKGGAAFIKDTAEEKGYRKTDYEYYTGAFYYLTPGTDAVLEHVRTVGVETVRGYSFEDIGRIAAEITEKTALQGWQMEAIGKFFDKGDVYLKNLQLDNTPQAQKERAFMEQYVARAKLAADRISLPSERGFITPKHNMMPESLWKTMSPVVIERVVKDLSEKRKSLSPQQASVTLLDEYRATLHQTKDADIRQKMEENLLVLRLMLVRGSVPDYIPRPRRGALAP